MPAERGRFTAPSRHMADEDRIVLTSVGVDIGSSTSHLLFSRLELERQDNRYVTVTRDVLYESDIMLTPYRGPTTIDSAALENFIQQQYRAARLEREQVDTGALILTGVALLRDNARAIADLFAAEAGRFVAVSAGDNLEATMAAHGSGAVALSLSRGPVMNVDIGGGTSKVVICREGRVAEVMAIDVGARLIAVDAEGRIDRLEPAGHAVAERLGLDLALGAPVEPADLQRVAAHLVDELLGEIGPRPPGRRSPLLRTEPLGARDGLAAVTFSGGVSEFMHGPVARTFGDMGPLIAAEIRRRSADLGAPIEPSAGRIRATVIGASQYTIQVSGSTIYLSPLQVVPLRNVPVVMPEIAWGAEDLVVDDVARAIRAALARFDLLDAQVPVAIAARWQGSATYSRIKAFCSGTFEAMQPHLRGGHPLVLVFDTDVGGLVGLHFGEELQPDLPIVSIDGVDLREFDYIDIGELIASSGAVPVVIKSLVFPAQPAPN